MGRGKEPINKRKHGISFEIAMRVWDDPHYLMMIDVSSSDEERWLAIGNIGYASVIVVVHADRGDEDDLVIRVISARKATKHEQARYDKEAFG
jgi:uncharacterized DUF497 family protein